MFRSLKYLALFILITLLPGCQGANLPYLVVLNQSNQEQDLKLVIGDKVVFEKTKVAATALLPMEPAFSGGTASLYFKASVGSEWNQWLNSEDKPFNCLLENGEIHLLTIETDGKTNFRKIHGGVLSGPQIAFINSSGRRIAVIQVSKNVNENMEVYHQDLPQGAVTNLYSVDPGTYSVFWQLPGRMDPIEAQYLMDTNGDPTKHTFVRGHTYFFWITSDQYDTKNPTKLYDFSLLP